MSQGSKRAAGRKSSFSTLNLQVLDLSRISTFEFRVSGPWPVSLRLNCFLNTKPRVSARGFLFAHFLPESNRRGRGGPQRKSAVWLITSHLSRITSLPQIKPLPKRTYADLPGKGPRHLEFPLYKAGHPAIMPRHRRDVMCSGRPPTGARSKKQEIPLDRT